MTNCANQVFGTLAGNVSLAIAHEGTTTIDEALKAWAAAHPHRAEEPSSSFSKKDLYGEPIKENRNSTLTTIGSAIIKRYGDSPEAKQLFLGVNLNRCKPPLDNTEVEQIWKKRQKWFWKTVAMDPNYTPADAYKPVDLPTLKPAHYSDMDQAEVLVRRYGGAMRFVSSGEWICYKGAVWDFGELPIEYLAQMLSNDQLDEYKNLQRQTQAALEAARNTDNKAAIAEAEHAQKANERYYGFVLKKRNAGSIKSIITTARANVSIDMDDLDSNAHIINTPEGIVDLATGELRQHRMEDYCTMITAAAPGDEGVEAWEDFLHTITCGDADLERYLQDICGRIAVGEVLEEGMVIAYGSGRNGKSTFFNTIGRVLGTYATTVNAQILV